MTTAESQADDDPGLEETGKTGMIERSGQLLGQITPGSDSVRPNLNRVLAAQRPVLNSVDRPLASCIGGKAIDLVSFNDEPVDIEAGWDVLAPNARDDDVLPSLDPVTDVVGREFDGLEG